MARPSRGSASHQSTTMTMNTGCHWKIEMTAAKVARPSVWHAWSAAFLQNLSSNTETEKDSHTSVTASRRRHHLDLRS
jgi:hypothetical protein